MCKSKFIIKSWTSVTWYWTTWVLQFASVLWLQELLFHCNGQGYRDPWFSGHELNLNFYCNHLFLKYFEFQLLLKVIACPKCVWIIPMAVIHISISFYSYVSFHSNWLTFILTQAMKIVYKTPFLYLEINIFLYLYDLIWPNRIPS